MSLTKGELVNGAFDEIGLNPDDFNVTPEHLEKALRRLDAMMAEWNGKGIRVSYALPSDTDSTALEEDSGMPDVANETVVLNLAVRIGPMFGKMISQDTRVTARQGYNTLLSRAVYPSPQPMPNTMPIGAGNKPWRYNRTFFPTPAEVIDAGADDPLTF